MTNAIVDSHGLSWKDMHGDEFEITEVLDAIGCILVHNGSLTTGVAVDEMDARALIGWLQRRIEQKDQSGRAA